MTLFDLLVRAVPGQVCEGGGPVWVLSLPLCPPQALLLSSPYTLLILTRSPLL